MWGKCEGVGENSPLPEEKKDCGEMKGILRSIKEDRRKLHLALSIWVSNQ
jgi:hypothetical protein